MSWKKYFKTSNVSSAFAKVDTSGNISPISGRNKNGNISSNAGMSSVPPGVANWESNLPDIYIGHPNRIDRYGEINRMDMDAEINAALDILAEFCTQSSDITGLPFEIHYNDKATDSEIKIIKEQLQQWCKINQFDQRIFRIFRNTLKFGDQVFVRDPETFVLHWTEIEKVIKIIVNEGAGKEPEQYFIKDLAANLNALSTAAITANTKHTSPPGGGGGTNFSLAGPAAFTGGSSRFSRQDQEAAIPAEHILHLSLSEGLDATWPFASSVLETVYKVYKQKELLEDAVIIYRLNRAPERRIFKIDVGNMPAHMAMAYVEKVKNEIQQRRIPTRTGGGNMVTDSTYNPISINEDFFFPVSEGRGSSVEQLPGGCLAMDTRVPLLDGRTLTIKELEEEYNNGKENWAFSCNPETGEVCPGLITWAGVTQKSADVLRITLDNGEEIIATPDHKFPVIGKGKVRADKLTVGESMIPFNTKNEDLSKTRKKEYTQVYQNDTKKWEFVHRMVCRFISLEFYAFDESIDSDNSFVIHHKDHNRYNNSPSNLVIMGWKDHKEYHTFHGFSKEAQGLGTKAAKAALEHMKEHDSEAYAARSKKISERSKKAWESLSDEERAKRLANLFAAQQKYLKNRTEEQKARDRATNISNLSGANAKLQKKLQNPEFREFFIQQKALGWEKFKQTEQYNERSKKISNYSAARAKDPVNYEKMFANQKLKYDKTLTDMIQSYLLSQGSKSTQTLSSAASYLSTNEEFMKHFRAINIGNNSKKWKGDYISPFMLSDCVKQHGYSNWRHFKRDVTKYNHKIVSIERLSDKIEVGTLTIDGDEVYHDYHNFALEVGIFTQNSSVGEVADLRFFTNKLFRGLRIPSSYLPTQEEESERAYANGKVGTALIQEWRFNQYCKRLQNSIIPQLDKEFKMFLNWRGINIDSALFNLWFTEPQNFAQYRQAELDTARISAFTQVEQFSYLSKRFILRRYLGLTEEEIQLNEEMWTEENGTAERKNTGSADMRSMGITPGGITSDMSAGVDMGLEGSEGELNMGGGPEGEPGNLGGPEGDTEPTPFP